MPKRKKADGPPTRADRRKDRTPGQRIDVANVNQAVVASGGRKPAKAATVTTADTADKSTVKASDS